jgi:rare lipoprotein A
MVTPSGLLTVLKRKLEAKEPLIATKPSTPVITAGPSVPAATPPAIHPVTDVPLASPAKPEPAKPVAKPTSAAAKPEPKSFAKPQAKPTAAANLIVQVGTFSAEAGAKSVAAKLSGKVSKAGRFWLARLGPFATRTEAQAALAKAKAAGYSDARIQRAD